MRPPRLQFILLYLYLIIFFIVRRCASLSPPVNGVIVGQCRTEYLSVCSMKCNEGYEAFGSVERTCVVSANNVMEWTGLPLLCNGK